MHNFCQVCSVVVVVVDVAVAIVVVAVVGGGFDGIKVSLSLCRQMLRTLVTLLHMQMRLVAAVRPPQLNGNGNAKTCAQQPHQ